MILAPLSAVPRGGRFSNQWIIDQRWRKRLGLRQDDQLTARELCFHIRHRADAIEDIYREIPSDRTGERQAKLQRGIAEFLEEP